MGWSQTSSEEADSRVSESHEALIARTLVASGIFDADFYRRAYVDVDSSGLSPLDHFVRFGIESSRQPSVAFDPIAYATRYPDIGGATKSVLHYAYYGRHERRDIGLPPFDPSRLEELVQTIQETGEFDGAFYRASNPALEDAQMDPLFHYLVHGHRAYPEPSATTSMRAYAGQYPDVREQGANPLAHWLLIGRHESRSMPKPEARDYKWLVPSRSFSLPDDIVHYERLSGEAYFAGQGFDFNERGTPEGVRRSVSAIAMRKPVFSISLTRPKVSIIVPVYGQMPFVLNCLDSLASHRSKYSVEIILADDASPEQTLTALLAEIPWIRYERRASNGGFLECCNSAVRLSRGEFVVLLNSDTRVVSGWLDELIDGFELFPKAGMTGSKLFNHDGTLQEAGGIFWRDGTAHNHGRGDDPNRPHFCHSRQADFISGASIALPRSVWDEMGGFDAWYMPAYCEDADLAFRLRRNGYEVWYLPFSRVIHYEGVTHGRDTTKGIKAYQVENLKKFAERFAAELLTHPRPGTPPVRAASWRTTRNLLVVDALTPRPDQDSGSIVTDEVMGTYRQLGFGETFYPQYHPVFLGEPTRRLQRMGVCCHYLPYSTDPKSIIDSSGFFDYALLYRHNVADVFFEPLRNLSPATRILFANVDLHYLRESRAATTTGDASGLFKAMVTKSRELALFARAHASFVHTEIEKKIIDAEMPLPLDNIVVLPWLIDVDEGANGFLERADIMFLGSFPHEPNVDSIKFFMRTIWPTLVEQLPPHAKLLIVGTEPPPEVLGMAGDRVVVTGYVEDLKPYFERSRVFVAPLRYGAGIKGKLILALAHGVPSVATPIAAEGIGSSDSGHLRVVEQAEDFAREVMGLYANEALWTQQQKAGLAFVQHSYSREAASSLCLKALQLADARWLEEQEVACRQMLERLRGADGSAGT